MFVIYVKGYSIALVLFSFDIFPLIGGNTVMDSDAANLSDIQSEILGQELPREYNHFLLIKLFHDPWPR